MKDEKLIWLLQAAEFGLANCNVSHDINNVLAILMGYAENLEYMLENNDMSKAELQDICDKMFYVIEKLNSHSRQIASDRKKLCIQEKDLDFTEYFHSWLKICTPLFKEKNLIPSFVSGQEYIIKQDWTRTQTALAELFSVLFQNYSSENPQKLEFYTDVSDKGVKLIFNTPSQFQMPSLPTFLGEPIHVEQDQECIQLQLSCFSALAQTKSAA